MVDTSLSCTLLVPPLSVKYLFLCYHCAETTIIIIGKMLIRYCKSKNMSVLAVVRKAEQVEELTELGARHVFNTSDENWKQEFKEKCAELNCTLAFDAVAGDLTGLVLHNMPKVRYINVRSLLVLTTVHLHRVALLKCMAVYQKSHALSLPETLSSRTRELKVHRFSSEQRE